METIKFTKEEIEIIERAIRDEIPAFGATPVEVAALNKFLDEAERVCREEDAFDQIGESLAEWYYNKYKAQEAEANEAE